MKTKLFLLCAAVLLLGTGARAQRTEPGRVPAKTATLISSGRGDNDKSVFNFQHGVRGDDKRSPMDTGVVAFREMPDHGGLVSSRGVGESEAQDGGNPIKRSGELAPLGRADTSPGPGVEPRRRYDIRYGGLTLNGTDAWLEALNYRDTRSVIKDLGAMSWSEVKSVPLLPPGPAPHPVVFRLGNDGVASPQNVFVRAVPGHMYLLRVKDAKADYQVMFRVESLDPAGGCTLSWKRVPTPKS